MSNCVEEATLQLVKPSVINTTEPDHRTGNSLEQNRIARYDSAKRRNCLHGEPGFDGLVPRKDELEVRLGQKLPVYSDLLGPLAPRVQQTSPTRVVGQHRRDLSQ